MVEEEEDEESYTSNVFSQSQTEPSRQAKPVETKIAELRISHSTPILANYYLARSNSPTQLPHNLKTYF